MAEPHRGNGGTEAERLRDLGREARDTGLHTAERTFEGARDSAAGRAQRTGEALREAAGRLEGDPIGSAMAMAADRLDELSDALRHQDLRGVLEQVQSFAQRQPALFVGGMLALGFAIGRFAAAGSGPELAGRAREEASRRTGGHEEPETSPGGAGVGLGAPSEATRPRPTATSAAPGGATMPGAATDPTVDPERQMPSTTHDPSGRPH